MTYPIAPAQWDSQFFGFPIGNIELPSDYDKEQLETTLKEAHAKFRLLFVSMSGEGPDSLSILGNRCPCYARKLFFKKKVSQNVEWSDPRIRAYTSTFCTPTLERLAIQAGTMTQFRQDPELAPHFEQLFLTWINFAVTKDLADSIWTCYDQGKHLGLVTIRSAKHVEPTTGRIEKEGRIGMLAVDAEHRRQGIGTSLIAMCDFWCSSLNIPVHAIATQKDNEHAIALGKKLGFQQDRETSIYHYWSPNWTYDARKGWATGTKDQTE
jgi:ribosomal protein S18 acetylase RimI-like enzyme